MARVATAASLFGVLAGAWVIVEPILPGVPQHLCTGRCAYPPVPVWAVLALAVILILVSLGGLVGPKFVFYVSAAVSALVLVASAVNSGTISALSDWNVLVGLGLAAASLALGLVAARSEGAVSEQSHPMNLPVFG